MVYGNWVAPERDPAPNLWAVKLSKVTANALSRPSGFSSFKFHRPASV